MRCQHWRRRTKSSVHVLHCLQHSRLPPTHTNNATAFIGTETGGGCQRAVDTGVGEQSSVHVLHCLQHSRLPPTQTTATSTNTDTGGGS